MCVPVVLPVAALKLLLKHLRIVAVARLALVSPVVGNPLLTCVHWHLVLSSFKIFENMFLSPYTAETVDKFPVFL